MDCLKDLGAGDWQLAGQVCQALCNMIGSGGGGTEKLLDTMARDSLLQILTTYQGGSFSPGRESRWDERACFPTKTYSNPGSEGWKVLQPLGLLFALQMKRRSSAGWSMKTGGTSTWPAGS